MWGWKYDGVLSHIMQKQWQYHVVLSHICMDPIKLCLYLPLHPQSKTLRHIVFAFFIQFQIPFSLRFGLNVLSFVPYKFPVL